MNNLKQFLIKQWQAFQAWKAKKQEIRDLKAQIEHEAQIEAIKRSKEVLVEKHIEEIKNPKEKKGLGQSLGLNLDANKMLGNMGVGNQSQMQSILGMEKPEPESEPAEKKKTRKRAKSKPKATKQPKEPNDGFGGMGGMDFNASLNKMLGK